MTMQSAFHNPHYRQRLACTRRQKRDAGQALNHKHSSDAHCYGLMI
ncbi:hypothetical protein [Ktedonosporobacter rubrisoli]|nr:hypothetical protein [Ktedonosporobacter rubrisoli]